MTLETARSISEERAEAAGRMIADGLPLDALRLKHWRTQIWREHKETMVSAPFRMRIKAEERDANLQADDDTYRHTSFTKLTPPFAETYGRANPPRSCPWTWCSSPVVASPLA